MMDRIKPIPNGTLVQLCLKDPIGKVDRESIERRGYLYLITGNDEEQTYNYVLGGQNHKGYYPDKILYECRSLATGEEAAWFHHELRTHEEQADDDTQGHTGEGACTD